jgi:hypothetical protein
MTTAHWPERRTSEAIVSTRVSPWIRQMVWNGSGEMFVTPLDSAMSMVGAIVCNRRMQRAQPRAKVHCLSAFRRRPSPGFFEAEQFEGVRAHLPGHLRPLVRLMYLTGWRRSEVT